MERSTRIFFRNGAAQNYVVLVSGLLEAQILDICLNRSTERLKFHAFKMHLKNFPTCIISSILHSDLKALCPLVQKWTVLRFQKNISKNVQWHFPRKKHFWTFLREESLREALDF